MKHFTQYLLLICSCIGLFTACNDNDDHKIDDPIIGTWDLKELQQTSLLTTRTLFMNWEAPEGTSLKISESISLPISVISPLIESQGSILLAQVLQNITFLSDGKIEATYSDAGIDLTAPVTPTWKTAKDYATYSIKGGQLFILLDMEKISALTTPPGRSSARNDMSDLVKLTTDGIPVNYSVSTDNTAIIYIDKQLVETILPLLKAYALSITDSDFDGKGATIKTVIGELPSILEETTKLEIGLNLIKQVAAQE